MENRKYYIYGIYRKNDPTKFIYIGQHIYSNINDSYMGSGKKLLQLYEEEGIENFAKEIIVSNLTKQEVGDKEKFFIAIYKEQNQAQLNISKGANSPANFVLPEGYKDYEEYKKDYFKNYYINNKEKLTNYHEQYVENNKEKISQQKKEYRELNKEKLDSYHNNYYQENKEEIKQYSKEYYQNNKERLANYYKEKRTEKNRARKATRIIRALNKSKEYDNLSKSQKRAYRENILRIYVDEAEKFW